MTDAVDLRVNHGFPEYATHSNTHKALEDLEFHVLGETSSQIQRPHHVRYQRESPSSNLCPPSRTYRAGTSNQ